MANVGSHIAGYGSEHETPQYFQLRMDCDPYKSEHVNVIINRSEMYTNQAGNYDWYLQVTNNMNGGHYCSVHPKRGKEVAN
jgi:hypothetical protein